MILSILAGLFLLSLVAVILYGYGFLMRGAKRQGDDDTEVCTLCRKKYPRHLLVVREIGDSRLNFFCKACIEQLHVDASKLT